MDANRNFSATVAHYGELSTIGITHGKVARIQNGRGAWVRVESGSVWLTRQHCTEDVILKAGTAYCVQHDGLTLLTNFGKQLALVTIEPPKHVAPARGERFWSFWARLYAPESRPTTAAL